MARFTPLSLMCLFGDREADSDRSYDFFYQFLLMFVQGLKKKQKDNVKGNLDHILCNSEMCFL